MNRTFYVHEHRQVRLIQRAVDAALAFLIASDMVVEVGEHLGSTEFGTIVSRLYIDPRSAAMIVSTLREKDVYTDLGLLQVICSTPDMPKLYVRNADVAALSRTMDTHSDELWLSLPGDDEGTEAYYRALKTAMLLSDWTDEPPDTKICERYWVGPGDIYGMVESVTWLVARMCRAGTDVCTGLSFKSAGIRNLHEKWNTPGAAATYPVTWDRAGSCTKII